MRWRDNLRRNNGGKVSSGRGLAEGRIVERGTIEGDNIRGIIEVGL